MSARTRVRTIALLAAALLVGCSGGSDGDDDQDAGSGLTLLSVTPNSGVSTGATPVQLVGTGFEAGCTVTIAGALAAGVTVTSGTSVGCVTPAMPAGALGWQPVTVTNPGGASATLVQGFAYYTPPIPAGATSSADPDVAADGTATLHVVWQSTNSSGGVDIHYQRSTDSGQTWSATPVNLSASSGASGRPRVAARGSTVFVVWNEPASPTAEVYHAYSGDGGVSWTSAARLSASGTTPDPDVAIDGNGRVVVVFSNASSGCAGCGVPAFSYISALSGSAGGPYTSNTANGGAVGPAAVAADGNGVVLCATAGYSAAMARSTDGGQTWGLPITVAAATAQTTYSQPAVALRGTTAILACRSAGTSGTLRSFRSSDGGATWGSGVSVAALAGTTVHPDATVESNGDVRVVWTDPVSAILDVFEAVSLDGGQSWGSATNLSANGGTSQRARISPGASGLLLRVWADDTGQPGVFALRTQ